MLDAGHHVAPARQFLGQRGEGAAGLGEAGESTTRGRPRARPAGAASLKALVRVLLNASYGTPVISAPFRMSSDSFAVMYGARFPPRDLAGYHRDTMSSLALAPGTQGSAREVSLRWRDVVPTGWGPVGSGRDGVPVRADDTSAATVPTAIESDAAEPGAAAQEAAATMASRAATVVAPRRIRRRVVTLPAPDPPCPESSEAGRCVLSRSINMCPSCVRGLMIGGASAGGRWRQRR
ncbi:hypothetical protein ACFQYP_06255 [Nonomuraea antimicrobica]